MYNASIWCSSGDKRLDNQSRINRKIETIKKPLLIEAGAELVRDC